MRGKLTHYQAQSKEQVKKTERKQVSKRNSHTVKQRVRDKLNPESNKQVNDTHMLLSKRKECVRM